mgnify:FL=1
MYNKRHDRAQTMKQPDLMTTKDIASMLKLSVGHVRDRITKGKNFPNAFRIGNKLRWNRPDILNWINENRETETTI